MLLGIGALEEQKDGWFVEVGVAQAGTVVGQERSTGVVVVWDGGRKGWRLRLVLSCFDVEPKCRLRRGNFTRTGEVSCGLFGRWWGGIDFWCGWRWAVGGGRR